MADASSSHLDDSAAPSFSNEPLISANLKFVISNLKNFVPVQLAPDNYAMWKSQILKIFRANGFHRFLDAQSSSPARFLTNQDGSSSPNPLFSQWILTDQNLAASLCSTISSSVLPYVISLDSTVAIWSTLQSCFQSSNRSQVIQLKNKFHNISLKNSSMTAYLSEIKVLVDQIAAAGSLVDTEDVILYILNGLPPSYQAFKMAIRTMLNPISLDQLYPLLLSEEINLENEASRALSVQDPTTALFTYRGRGRRSRGRASSAANGSSRPNPHASTICQIRFKKGHSAQSCWHRLNTQYTLSPRTGNNALLATADAPASN
ncbi:hypothetical protein M5K25_024374 [Dendrobium thyrsiflorum]|uniref:Retrovirus-related Pol polyprotein from transposon TNT 1-94 n=1 Tax=Dendrobium thyrsiflorum TaxID=117978 RepID=A0ABD0U229_DENTH